MKPQSMVNCQLNFNNNVFDFQASEIVAAETMFDTALGKIKGQNCSKSTTMNSNGGHRIENLTRRKTEYSEFAALLVSS